MCDYSPVSRRGASTDKPRACSPRPRIFKAAFFCNQDFDFSQGIEGHPELILVAIVDDNGNVIPVLGSTEEQSQDEQPSDGGETSHA